MSMRPEPDPETAAPPPDLLAALLREAGLRRRMLEARPINPSELLRFMCERSIGFHVVMRGPVWLHCGDERLHLQTGDVAVMARGKDHQLASREQLDGLIDVPLCTEAKRVAVPDDGTSALVLSGAYQLWHAPVHPFFRALPAWHVLRADAQPAHGPAARALALLRDEMHQPQPGGSVVRHALLDVLFTYLLRDLMAAHAGHPGFLGAQADSLVRRAIELMQVDCARAWTLPALAAAVGLSRSVLAARFRAVLGDTPLNFLRVLRIQRAMRLLSETDHKLEAVAAEVGYADAFTLSKTFKRLVGLSPLEFRRGDRATVGAAWRFGPGEPWGGPGG